MKKILLGAILFSSSILSGCATPEPSVYHYNGTKECDLAWQRAQLKLASFSTLTVVTDVLIQGNADDGIRRINPVSAIRQNKTDGSCNIVIKALGSFGIPLTDKNL